MSVKITNYGGTVTSIRTIDKNGDFEEVALGFDSLQDYLSKAYLKEGPYFGAIIGRFGNRIAKGKFKLEGSTFSLATNNGPNHLHGGNAGFDKVIWQSEEFGTNESIGVKLKYISPDMEEGYPGKINS